MEATNKEQSPALKELYGRMVNNTSEVSGLSFLVRRVALTLYVFADGKAYMLPGA